MTDLQQFTENGGSPSQVTLEDIDVGIEIDLQDGNGTENVKKGHADGGDSGVGSDYSQPVTPTDHTMETPLPTTEPVQSPTAKGMATRTPAHHNGPDELMPADSTICWHRDGAVKLRLEDTGPLSEKPLSVHTMFLNTVKRSPNLVAMAQKREGVWVKWTYQEYYAEVQKAAKSMIALGLERYHGVGIIGFNSPEWFMTALGSIFAGGLATGIYSTNSPEACHFVANNCKANILVVENTIQLNKILKVRDSLPHLKAIVQYSGELAEKHADVYTWAEFIDVGKSVSDDVLQDRIRSQAPNQCCTLIYTSGTTGNPKGVMLSQDNLMWTASMAIRSAILKIGEERIISYLPLSHVAAQIVDIYAPMLHGASVWFAQPDALKGSLLSTLTEVQPTLFLGVPRVWEKIQEKLQALGKQTVGVKKMIATWAKDIGLRGNMSLMKGGSVPFGWTIANALVFKKVRHGLGLDSCKLCISAAAPIMKETLEFFMSLNIPVTEMYGMSESTGPHTVSFAWKYQLGSCGFDMVGVTTKIDNPDKEHNGEICMSGRHVCMGYLDEEEKTREVLEEGGWLHTGDIGHKDDKGFLFITGRIKELIITAGGENVAPVPIEDIVKEELPIISNCMLVGDKRKFLSMLLTLKCEVDPETTLPKEALTKAALDWCTSAGSKSLTVSEACRDEAVKKAIQAGVDRANKKAESNAKRIGKWTILPTDFSLVGGELGPTMKLKRPVVTKMYQSTIDAFYAEV